MKTFAADLLTSSAWRDRLIELAGRHHVPGAQIGVMSLNADGKADLRVATTGVISLSTEVAVTPEALFQYGSITKVWTTTLIMQLVDEKLLDLEAKVVDILDDFTLADPHIAPAITVRQLLTHRSGIDGDVFIDTGDGDDCVARYVRGLATAVSVTKPSGHLSYCNAGFVVAGRIVEVLRNSTWDDALAKYLLQPLGLRHTITKAKDAPLFRTAVGHLQTSADSEGVEATTTWMLPRSIGPAGLITGSVHDLLCFAATHLRDGVGLDGTRVLSSRASRAMRELEVDLSDDSTTQRGWGLGWAIPHWGTEPAVGHGGGTIGQVSDLHLFPERQLAIAVLTNSRGGSNFIVDVLELLGNELDLTPPAPRVSPNAAETDLSPMIGRYESTATRWDLTLASDGGLRLAITSKHAVDGDADPEPQTVLPAGPGRFVVKLDDVPIEVSLVRSEGRDYLFYGRLLERAS